MRVLKKLQTKDIHNFAQHIVALINDRLSRFLPSISHNTQTNTIEIDSDLQVAGDIQAASVVTAIATIDNLTANTASFDAMALENLAINAITAPIGTLTVQSPCTFESSVSAPAFEGGTAYLSSIAVTGNSTFNSVVEFEDSITCQSATVQGTVTSGNVVAGGFEGGSGYFSSITATGNSTFNSPVDFENSITCQSATVQGTLTSGNVVAGGFEGGSGYFSSITATGNSTFNSPVEFENSITCQNATVQGTLTSGNVVAGGFEGGSGYFSSITATGYSTFNSPTTFEQGIVTDNLSCNNDASVGGNLNVSTDVYAYQVLAAVIKPSQNFTLPVVQLASQLPANPEPGQLCYVQTTNKIYFADNLNSWILLN